MIYPGRSRKYFSWAKHHEESMSPALEYYQDQLNAPFAFQLVIDADYVEADCFSKPDGPLVVPARTLLSQLMQEDYQPGVRRKLPHCFVKIKSGCVRCRNRLILILNLARPERLLGALPFAPSVRRHCVTTF
jgi:hypothetical protein